MMEYKLTNPSKRQISGCSSFIYLYKVCPSLNLSSSLFYLQNCNITATQNRFILRGTFLIKELHKSLSSLIPSNPYFRINRTTVILIQSHTLLCNAIENRLSIIQVSMKNCVNQDIFYVLIN